MLLCISRRGLCPAPRWVLAILFFLGSAPLSFNFAPTWVPTDRAKLYLSFATGCTYYVVCSVHQHVVYTIDAFLRYLFDSNTNKQTCLSNRVTLISVVQDPSINKIRTTNCTSLRGVSHVHSNYVYAWSR